MVKAVNPRRGSMGYWPRRRAKRSYARIRSWPTSKDAKILGFAGYKVGMTHVSFTDTRNNSPTKKDLISFPVTVIECPPIKIASVVFYKKSYKGLVAVSQILAQKLDKELTRKIILPKEPVNKDMASVKYDDIRLLAYTQPKLTGIGRKKPEVFELCLGGDPESKLSYAKENLGKEININDIFNAGQVIDFHVVTKGKGFQGPVKIYGVKIRSRKSEKVKRGPGSLGPWSGQGHIMYRVPHAHKQGHHTRIEYNKLILAIGDKPEQVNPKGGFVRYGFVKNNYILVKGSVGGAVNSIVRFKMPIRPNKKLEMQAPADLQISLESKQGR